MEDLPLDPEKPLEVLDLGLENRLEDDEGFISRDDELFLLEANRFRLDPNPLVFDAGVAITVGVNEVRVIVVAGSPVFFFGKNVGLGLDAKGRILGVNVFFFEVKLSLDLERLPPSLSSSPLSSSFSLSLWEVSITASDGASTVGKIGEAVAVGEIGGVDVISTLKLEVLSMICA